jgi:hypothetical protein
MWERGKDWAKMVKQQDGTRHETGQTCNLGIHGYSWKELGMRVISAYTNKGQNHLISESEIGLFGGLPLLTRTQTKGHLVVEWISPLLWRKYRIILAAWVVFGSGGSHPLPHLSLVPCQNLAGVTFQWRSRKCGLKTRVKMTKHLVDQYGSIWYFVVSIVIVNAVQLKW